MIQALLDDLATVVGDHEYGCSCELCEAWRLLASPEYLADSSN